MERRSLRYTDTKSDKFWTITLEGVSHTVQYGRVGTTGQLQTKDFGSETEARKSYEKLVAEKLKKGYVEDEAIKPPASAVTSSSVAAVQAVSSTTESVMPQEWAADWRELALSEIQAHLTQNKKQLCELAAINAIPNEYLALLNLEVRTAIASQPTTDKALLAKLAADSHDTVRQAIAGNPSTPEDCLKQLAKDLVRDVRYALARNVYAPSAVLECLADEVYINIRKAICENPNTTDALFERVAHDLDKHQRHRAHCNQAAAYRKRDVLEPATGWDKIIRPTPWMRENMPNVDWNNLTLEKILSFSSLSDKTAIIQDSRTPAHLLEELAKHDQSGWTSPNPVVGHGFLRRGFIQEAVACNPNTPLAALKELAKTNNLFVCMALASNSALPGELIREVFESEGFLYAFEHSGTKFKWEEYEVGHGPGYETWLDDLSWEIARNPNTPTDILEKLTQHKVTYVRQMAQKQSCDRGVALANNPETPLTTLQALLKHRDLEVRAAVAKNSKGFPEFLKMQLRSSKSLERLFGLMHPKLLKEQFLKAAQSSEWHDRFAITQNPSTSPEILQQLAQDTEPVVQNAAKVALGLETSVEQPVVQAEIAQAPEQIESAEIAPKAPEPTAVAEKLEIVRSLNLNPEDWLWATWRPRNVKIRPKAKPFNRQEALERLSQIKGKSAEKHYSSACFYLEWDKAEISISLDKEEALFWLKSILLQRDVVGTQSTLDGLISQMRSESLTENLTLQDILYRLISDGFKNPWFRSEIVLPLFNLFPFIDLVLELRNLLLLDGEEAVRFIETSKGEELMPPFVNSRLEWMTREQAIQAFTNKTLEDLRRDIRTTLDRLLQGFEVYLWSYLTDPEREEMRARLRLIISQEDLASLEKAIPGINHCIYLLAAYLGMHDIAYEAVKNLPDNSLSWGNWGAGASMKLLCGIEHPDILLSQIQRLQFTPRETQSLRACLAWFEYQALPLIRDGILINRDKEHVIKLIETLATCVDAPELAPYMLEFWKVSKSPQTGRQWLEDHPTHAIVGLMPVAAGVKTTSVQVKPKDMENSAIAFLLSMKRKGYESLIHAALEQQPPEIAEKLTALILDPDDIKLPSFDEKTTPQWLKESLADLNRQKRTKPLDWVSPADLPPIAVGNHCLNEDQINACLGALNLSTLESPLPLVQHLKTHANPQSLDAFIWSLFERWLTEGGSSKEKWAMIALGLLGTDAIALKLTPLIRNWPAENQHPRAVLGLECLRTMGTDTALMQINGIAQKIKFQGLKKRAQECMEAIARDLKLTAEQLEDRIIPDCGLDETGRQVFDFGSRQFQFALGPDLKPLVRDDQGKLLSSLPKPTAKDDAQKAQQAIADWKLVKKQIGEVVKIQSFRLEQAMINERRWTWQEFQTLLVKHPLMTHLVQRLIWDAHNAQEHWVKTFRVAEDQTFTDQNDEPFTPTGTVTVGIIHSLHLCAEAKAAWGQTLSDYEIIPPFSQIDRAIYALTPEELEAKDITRFKDIQIPATQLVRMLESSGWQRGRTDQGEIQVHCKYFPKSNLTAIVGEYENVFHGGDIYGTEAIDGCCFVSGHYIPEDYPQERQWATSKEPTRKTLGTINPLLMSEVLRELTAIATAAQS